jgi:hypothetical protein
MTGYDAARIAPEDAFALLGNESRIAILRALWESPYEPLSFSELRERVGMRDSGQFNYHLGKLLGRFVRKAAGGPESDPGDASDGRGGYELTLAGWQVLGAILSGQYASGERLEPVKLDDPCKHCGGTVSLRYENERMRIRCEECEEVIASGGVPPGVIEGYDPSELPDVFWRLMRSFIQQAQLGFCVSCRGRMRPEIRTEPDGRFGRTEEDAPFVVFECERCPERISTSVGDALLDHPAVVSFHYERGVDLRDQPPTALPWVADDHAVVESDDPLRVRVTIELDGDRLELLIDDSLNVLEVFDPLDAAE